MTPVSFEQFQQELAAGARRWREEQKDLQAEAIREGRFFYGYRADKETYAQFQKRALKEIGRA